VVTDLARFEQSTDAANTDTDLTQTQLEVEYGLAEGQSIWHDILEGLDTTCRAKVPGWKGKNKRKSIFDFLNLPAEFRNRICQLYIALDDEEHREKYQCELSPHERKKPCSTKKQKEAANLALELRYACAASWKAVKQRYTDRCITEHAFAAFDTRAW
jgi:hypothetical protein